MQIHINMSWNISGTGIMQIFLLIRQNKKPIITRLISFNHIKLHKTTLNHIKVVKTILNHIKPYKTTRFREE